MQLTARNTRRRRPSGHRGRARGELELDTHASSPRLGAMLAGQELGDARLVHRGVELPLLAEHVGPGARDGVEDPRAALLLGQALRLRETGARLVVAAFEP